MEIDRLSVWLTIPSAKAVPEAQACVNLWRSMGYLVALWRDQHDAVNCDLKLVSKYPGYATACNALIREVMERYEDAQWFICAGDDIEPDRTKRADEIAEECVYHFEHCDLPNCDPMPEECYGTFGVMQPTGDGYGSDTICGSAWIGREWAKRMYGGNGPLWHEYTHCFVDNELQEVAKLSGALWQRPDLSQHHKHWQREKRAMPAYLAEANSPQHWEKFLKLFEYRKAKRFPGAFDSLEKRADSQFALCG